MRKLKTPAKPGTKKRRRGHGPTIGVGEDKILGRGDGGRAASLGKGDLGENIPQSSRDADAIANIDQSQNIMTGGGGDAGTNDDGDGYDY
jgi:hypothetical protein